MYNPSLTWDENSTESKLNYATKLSRDYFQYIRSFENLTICIQEIPILDSFLQNIIENETIYHVIDCSKELKDYLKVTTKDFNSNFLSQDEIMPIFQNISHGFGNIAHHFEQVM